MALRAVRRSSISHMCWESHVATLMCGVREGIISLPCAAKYGPLISGSPGSTAGALEGAGKATTSELG